LVIPGWSILPAYFLLLFPNENLIILNEFIGELDIPSYCSNELKGLNIETYYQPVDQVSLTEISSVFVFSMGFQWASTHMPELFDFPCIIGSPAVSYDSTQLDQMINNLNRSCNKTLRSFYRQCFESLTDWQWWKSALLESHLNYNTPKRLIEWLETYGRKHVSIPDKKNISVWFNAHDSIGVKPEKNTLQLAKLSHVQSGHIITPQ
jgi:hypothetical protein